ncbi:hypothetical protein H2199_002004 [Coniosporium tulheliwenetii]|uniref:Uncharacterized protein n=1 Tax=Coniosporium tulheliwenetii TaxID=3383036 RepID=A0ACC2ZHF8_9PEZI|nr:hypothetical protein H2199_002004 [Cladosporium sp. JES 115]
MPIRMKPHVSRKGKNVQLSYDLPYRINCAKVYPVKSPSGSTIIIYGHNAGLTVLWRGGKPLKPTVTSKDASAQAQSNGNQDDAVMIIDSDDEAPPVPSSSQPQYDAELESEDEEHDPSEPYPPVVQHLDLPLPAEVLHLSVPRLPPSNLLRSGENHPSIFSHKIVLSVACTDCTIRVLALPLTPPSAVRKSKQEAGSGIGFFGREQLELASQHGHQSMPDNLSMTWTSRQPLPAAHDLDPYDEEDTDDAGSGRGSLVARDRSRSRDRSDMQEWDLLVASHSSEAAGLLIISRVMLPLDGSLSSGQMVPFQVRYLRSPAVKIAFNPTIYPYNRHTRLLVAERTGAVRVYDPLSSPSRRPRSSSRSNVSFNPQAAPGGSWLGTFLTNYRSQGDPSAISPAVTQRKRILDAQWASSGKSIVALLSDGEWGVWDIDGSGPTSVSRTSANTSPISFALRGSVGASSSSLVPSSSTVDRFRGSSTSLAPMTPNTRRTKEESLFSGHISSHPGAPKGGICVSSTASNTGGAPYDSILIWYDNSVYRIPNLQQYWARTTSGNTGSLYGSGLARIESLDLQGEFINGIEQFELESTAAKITNQRDLLVVAERRLILLGNEIKSGKDVTLFRSEQEQDGQIKSADQKMLASQELDLAGMGRVLDGMNGASNGIQTGLGKRVGFAA